MNLFYSGSEQLIQNLVECRTNIYFLWWNVTNLLFRHRLFASVNCSTVCNMFVICVKCTVGTLLSTSSTFFPYPFSNFLTLFCRSKKYSKLRQCLFSFYHNRHLLLTCCFYLYLSNHNCCNFSDLIHMTTHFILIRIFKYFDVIKFQMFFHVLLKI